MADGPRWFEKAPPGPSGRPRRRGGASGSPAWTRCPGCRALVYREDLARALGVCPDCGHHFRLDARRRIDSLVDPDSFERHDARLASADPLGFVDTRPYADRLAEARARTGEPAAYLAGSARIDGIPVQVGAFDFRFLGGSMGSAVGELVTRQVERATARREALVIVSASGGARMQEGVLSLMQMARTTAALARFRAEAGRPFISVLAHPTTGGVAASFAMLGDVILAEPGALVGFAGPRVIAQTIGHALPEGFQTSEYLLEHGMVDRVVRRPELRPTLARLLHLLVDPS